MLRLEQHGTWMDSDTRSIARLHRSLSLRVVHGRLSAAISSDARKLQAAIGRLTKAVADISTVALRIGDQQRVDLLLSRIENAVDSVSQRAPRIIVYVSEEEADLGLSIPQVQSLFQLTPREAALTVILCAGRTLVEAAQELGITEQTARSYSREIFQKTGTNRQADLIRRVLTSVAAIS